MDTSIDNQKNLLWEIEKDMLKRELETLKSNNIFKILFKTRKL